MKIIYKSKIYSINNYFENNPEFGFFILNLSIYACVRMFVWYSKNNKFKLTKR